MKRRSFLALLGGAAAGAWPQRLSAQQTMPVIGFLNSLTQALTIPHMAAFRRGLGETGYTEGQNVTIESRFAEGQYDRLPAMASEFVRRPVSLIVAGGPPAALAAKTATTTIPIVFIVGLDPVAAGLVASYNRPGGNATGMALISGPLGQKRLEMLRDLNPKVAVVAMLVNPLSPDAPPEIREVQTAARAFGIQLRLLNASTPGEIDTAFAAIAAQRPDAILISADPFFVTRRDQLIAHVARTGLPAAYPFREFTEVGGLMSYGTSIANAYRQAGIYAGKILKGARPADLPVMQPVRFEYVINLQTAKALGIEIPPILHARADEVIE